MDTLSSHGPKTRFGWIKAERTQYLNGLQSSTPSSTSYFDLMFQGVAISRPIFRVPIGLPMYRLMNGRTAALQLQYVATHGLPVDYFRNDLERLDIQIHQHDILLDLLSEQSLLDYFRNPQNVQTEPLILDHTGFVVNGNRRLSAYRELFHEFPAKYPHFEYVRAVVLPVADAKAIDALEAILQLHQDIRADYSWYARAQMFLDRQLYHGFSTEGLASLYEVKAQDIEELLEMHRFASEYLRSRGREHQWSSLGNQGKYAFEKLVRGCKGLSGEKARLFQELAFKLIDDPSGGRLYDHIPKLRANLDSVVDRVAVVVDSEVAQNTNEQFAEQADLVENQRIQEYDPFAPMSPSTESSGYVLADAIADADVETQESIIEAVKDAILASDEVKRQAASSNLLLEKLKKANVALADGVAAGLSATASAGAVSGQLVLLEEKIGKIREFLEARDGTA